VKKKCTKKKGNERSGNAELNDGPRREERYSGIREKIRVGGGDMCRGAEEKRSEGGGQIPLAKQRKKGGKGAEKLKGSYGQGY